MKMRRHSKLQAARWSGCPACLHVPAFWRPLAQAQWKIARGIVNWMLYRRDDRPMRNPRGRFTRAAGGIFLGSVGGPFNGAG